MSRRNEEDWRRGQIKDLADERAEFSRQVWIDEMILAIDGIVRPIVEQYIANGERGQIDTILCHKSLEVPASFVALKFGLDLTTSLTLPENEVLVTLKSKVDVVVQVRADRKRGRGKGLWLPK